MNDEERYCMTFFSNRQEVYFQEKSQIKTLLFWKIVKNMIILVKIN